MQEIWIPELIVALFLLLHIIRPLVKKLISIDGFAWLPLPCLIIIVFLFPAYGFRPELIPLLLCSAVLSAASISWQLRDDDIYGSFRKTRLFFVVPFLLVLAASVWIALYFTPQKDTAFCAQGVFTLKTSSGTDGEKEYFLRLYTDVSDNRPSQRPLIAILPPMLGSLAAVDQVACELRDRGFTVLVSSRRGFDSPAIHISADGRKERHGIGAVEWLRRIRLYFFGNVSEKKYLWGRSMEEARKEDLFFLLSLLRENVWFEGQGRLFDFASRDAVFFAGYDAGGSALILAGDSLGSTVPEADLRFGMGSAAQYRNTPEIRIRGFIAVDSFIWSAYRLAEKEIPELPPGAGWFASVKHGINRWLLGIKPKEVSGPEKPEQTYGAFLFLAGGKKTDYRFLSISSVFEAAKGRSVLVSADGTGSLDFSDFPFRYPLIADLVRGRQNHLWEDFNAPAVTAGIIANFAAQLIGYEEGYSILSRDNELPAGILFNVKRNSPIQAE